MSGLYERSALEPVLRPQGAALGMDQADRWLALSDGGNGLEDFLEGAFPRVEAVILDYWHASEYLTDLARFLYLEQEDKAEETRRWWCQLLKDEGGAAALAYLREEAWAAAPAAASAVQEQWERVQTYFGNQQHRMEDPEYEARGWSIGSGVVESACKTVVAQRLKGAGMRWSEDGADAVCHVRALYRSEKGQWEAFWTPPGQN